MLKKISCLFGKHNKWWVETHVSIDGEVYRQTNYCQYCNRTYSIYLCNKNYISSILKDLIIDKAKKENKWKLTESIDEIDKINIRRNKIKNLL